ncbi:phage tail protein [Paracraurococcus ruber]|uniref:Fibronectin type-III domain-containing protein n=1 Tax=Paracraurococcus ruber TaxID=77675 RepID=A0ABS1CR50_9PROT|nr:phage tail protein [Paracraurococcus ruber]MBK1656838.1 hypothetical protein [Paracraurococcus ruber]TDG33953.1 hypothetical protein E2C05_01550 [Paracraurococcus ruber]
MPPIAIAVVAAAASAIVATAPAVIAILGVQGAIIAGAVLGAVISVGLGMLFQGSQKSVQQNAQDSKQLIRSPVSPRRVVYGRAKISGSIVYAFSGGVYQEKLWLVIALTAHPIDAFEAIHINDESFSLLDGSIYSGGTMSGGRFGGSKTGKFVLGLYDGTQTVADAGLISASPDGWSSAHKLQGCAYAIVNLTFDKDLFQNGIPNVSFTIRGKKVFDPRSSSTYWTDNWALCIRDYLTSSDGLACASGEYDDATIIAAANISDEAVPLNLSGTLTQPRYRLNGSFTLDEKPIDIMEQMLTAGAGALTYVAGAYQLFAGAYVSPSATLTASDFAGTIEVQTKPTRAELFNGIKGTYVEPQKYWQAAEFLNIQDSTARAADGEDIWREVEYRFVINQDHARRLALQTLKRMRAPLVVKAPLRYAGLTLKVWDTVALTLPDFGWSAKPFRVVAWSFDPAQGTVNATFQEEQVAAYAWTYDVAAGVPNVPTTTLVDPLTIPAPTGLTIAATTALQGDGGTVPALAVSWTAAAHPFVTAYEVNWRVTGSTPWATVQVADPSTRFVIAPVLSGVGYDVRVRAIAQLASSPWTGTATATGAPDTTAPGAPTGATVTAVPKGFVIRWTNAADADLDNVEVWESPTTSGYYQVARSRTNFITLSGYNPADVRYFAIRSVDRSGNTSGFAFIGPATVPRNATNDIASNAITGSGNVALTAGISLTRPGSGYAFGSLGGLTITLNGDGRAIIFARAPYLNGSTGSGSGSGGSE